MQEYKEYYMHITCNSRRKSIQENGLKINSKPNINDDDDEDNKLYFVYYIHISYDDFYSSNEDINKKTIEVMCFLAKQCGGLKNVDFWVLNPYSKYNKYISPHHINNEYVCERDIPISELILITDEDTIEDYKSQFTDDDCADYYSSH